MNAKELRNRKGGCEVNLAAFSDIAFQLIIFFIVAATFNKPRGREMDLPSVEEPEEKSDKKEKEPTVTVTNMDLQLAEGGGEPRRVSRIELTNWLRDQNYAEKVDEDRIVILQADDYVGYGRYFDVVNMITRAGAVIAIIEEEGEDES